MNWIGELLRRFRFRLDGERFDQDLAEEMRLHQDLRAAEKQAAGMSPGMAETVARRRFGNQTRISEASREAWGWTFLDTVQQDLRYGLRALAANPGFTATAVLSLVLGIGANTAIFSILNAVMLRSLPVEEPQQLVQIRQGTRGTLTNPIWEQVRDHQQAFSGALAYSADRFDLADGGPSQFAAGLWVSGDFFRVLGVPAALGRVLTTEDDRRGGAGGVVVISHRFWTRYFQGDASAVGRTIRLNRHSFQIVGVTPAWFTGLDSDRSYDVAIPLASEPLLRPDRSFLDHRAAWWLQILGRLRPGESLQQAESRMKAIAPETFRATLPLDWQPQDQKEFLESSFSLSPAAKGFSATGRQYRRALFVLMTIVGLVLLIACANIANLLLARAAARQREVSVRMAIGASRRRVVRQLMTESLLLSVLGAVGGFLLALWGSRLLVRLISRTSSPLVIDLSPDLRVLAFTIAVTVLTALLFGLTPALRATRVGVNPVLKENSRGVLEGSTRSRLRRVLVTAQIALSLVLLVGAVLFLATFQNLLRIDAGFSRQNVLLVRADVQQAAIPAPRRVRVYGDILDRLRKLPGVVSASSSLITPISGLVWNGPTEPEGYVARSRDDTLVSFNRVSPGYFRTMRTALLLGRDFSERDVSNSPKVMILDESASRKFFGSASPIGKRMGMMGGPGETEICQIIGVAKDAKYARINEPARRTAYVAASQDSKPEPWINYEVRSDGPAEALIPSVRAMFSEVNRGISLEFRSLETQVSESLLQQRIVALLSSIFGVLALLLAMVGLYGVTSYTTLQRRSEIGVRIALGAQKSAVFWLVMRDVVIILAAGTALGLAAALATGRLVASLLYGIRPNDPLHLAGAAITLAAATAIAAYLPARRAARLDPMSALREE